MNHFEKLEALKHLQRSRTTSAHKKLVDWACNRITILQADRTTTENAELGHLISRRVWREWLGDCPLDFVRECWKKGLMEDIKVHDFDMDEGAVSVILYRIVDVEQMRAAATAAGWTIPAIAT